MTTFTNSKAFVQHIGRYGQKLYNLEPEATKAAALAATRDFRGEAKGFHIGKARLGVGYTMTGRSSAVITPRGPWMLVEKGARSHVIAPKRRGRRGRGARAALFAPGYAHPIARPVRHPGTGPLGHPWEEGLAKAKRSAPRAFEKVVKKVFA